MPITLRTAMAWAIPLALMPLGSTLALAQRVWDAGGMPVAPYPPAHSLFGVSVGMNGGAYIAWPDERHHIGEDEWDPYLQRLLPDGTLAPGWPLAGLLLGSHPSGQYPKSITRDGADGVFVFWEDRRNLPTGGDVDIYGTRVTGAGTLAPGWAVGGTPIAVAAGYQKLELTGSDLQQSRAVPDGVGGAYLIWDDRGLSGSYDSSNVYVQRVGGGGTLAAGWPANGLPLCTAPNEQVAAKIVSDGLGGAVVAWDDDRGTLRNVYALRVLGDGTIAPGWTANGTALSDSPGSRGRIRIVPDGAGGALFAWLDLRSAPAIPDPYDYFDVYAQRLTASGEVAPGWPSGGKAVRTAPRAQDFLVACTDGAGGIFVAWTDQADGVARVSRLTGAGEEGPGWPAEGRSFAVPTGAQYMAGIVPDEVGGCYLVWENYGLGPEQVYVQRITPAGEPVVGWPPEGLSVAGPPSAYQDYATACADELGGVVVVWEDAELVDGRARPRGLYAQRFGPGGPTPVAVSLVSAEAEAGAVRLAWYAPQGAGITASVERRAEASEWERLGAATVGGDGTIRYEDRTASAGERYGYRLGYSDGTGVGYTDETWVAVPAAVRFALRGPTPNPSAGDAVVRLSLGHAGSATLEVYDVGGRRVSTREVGGLGVGAHELRLSERGRLAAGVYTVRLRQGPESAMTRAVVVR